MQAFACDTKIQLSDKFYKLQKVNLYVDGFNLYFGLRHFRSKYKWLDLLEMGKQLCRKDQQLGTVYYFTARITGKDKLKIKRQVTYLEALAVTGVEIVLGKYLNKQVKCRKCGKTYVVAEEKESDVNLATHLLVDAAAGAADVCLVVSADSDLILPMEKARDVYKKIVVPVFPPNRQSREIKKRMGNHFYMNETLLRNSQLPPTVPKADGYKLYRPSGWK
ncbi:6-hydroxy-3-succinoylpyridine 3-monooxygenase HspA [Neolewinella maritima]|uniref:6-hydroxy-3-succinoylpyridine 3-monooxygenase HspA n=1 Tax=Neolewinella maritima TaxID=1383882 RepID=A0ABM9B549_9BACT|nr:NYN domain-containing protein [Neolewinella maritima]CAH1002433.1 6-hydroxy-3-succinoylpyridine 3-monooxygenase HspA [Neolewinella maritima]